VAQLVAVDEVCLLAQTWPSLGVEFQVVRHPLRTTWLSIALTCLVAPDPEQAEAELMHLTYSRRDQSRDYSAQTLPQLKSESDHQPRCLCQSNFFFLAQPEGLSSFSSAGSSSWD